MKVYKKLPNLLAMIITVTLAISIFASCTKTDSKTETMPPGGASSGENPDTGKPNMEEKFSFTIAARGSNVVDNDAKYIKMMEEKYNFDIDVLPCYGDEYASQVKMLLAGGEVPDVIRLGEDLQLADLVSQDLLAEITMDDLNNYMPAYVEQVSKYSDSPFKYAKIDGKIYSLISQNPDGEYHFTCIWRSDWLENVGIAKVPETLEEYEEALYKFAKEDPDGNGKSDTYGLSDRGFTPVFGAFGYLPYRLDAEYLALKDGEIVHSASQPEMKEALRLLNNWYKDGVIDPEFLTGERTAGHWSSSQAFAKGTIGYTSTGMYYNTGRASDFGRDGKLWKLFRETQDSLNITTSDYVHGRPPIGPDGKSGNIKWGIEEGPSFAFSKELKEDKNRYARVLMWMDDLNFDLDNWLSAQYGEKGTDWTYDETTKILKYGLSPETKQADENEDWAPLGLGYLFINDYIDLSKSKDAEGYEFADKVANFTEGYYEPVSNAPLLSRAKYDVDLVKLTVTAYTDMITGKKSIDEYFDKYAKEWEEAGGAEVLAEANEWYKVNASN